MTGTETFARWRADNALWLLSGLEHLRLFLTRRALRLQQPGQGGTRRADWLLATEGAPIDRETGPAASATSAALDDAIAASARRCTEVERRMRDDSHPPALLALAELAGLSEFERSVLLIAAAPSFDGTFAPAYAELNDDARRPYATLHLALALFAADPLDRLLRADALVPSAPLRAFRLVQPADGDEPLLTRRLVVDARVSDYLRGAAHLDERVLRQLTAVPAATAVEEIDRTSTRVARLVADQNERWATLNLVGTTEGGARSVAQRACAALGLRLMALDPRRLAALPAAERADLLALCGRDALLSGLAFVVDANGLEPSGAAALVVDEIVEHALATVFVVSAERWRGDSDAVRESHVIEVLRPDRSEQRALWRAELSAYRNSINGDLDTIVEQFDFGPPAIADSVARASKNADVITAKELWRSCREQVTSGVDQLAQRIVPAYGWDDIVLSDGVRGQLRELADQVAMRGTVYGSWGFARHLTRGRGITALFAGDSGTGKTMAAEILAAHLDLDLFRIDLAGVVSKYIGETEKNLRQVFDAAERSGAILFFDEADALFGSRTEVRDSHDRYANVEVNYLLQRMEDYAGLAILATNRRAALDSAFVRRLRFVIEFPVPSADERRRIWASVFPAEARVGDLELGYLAQLELTGGNIKSIAVNAAFLAAAEGARVGMTHLVRATAREYRKLGKPVSAAEFGPYFAVARP